MWVFVYWQYDSWRQCILWIRFWARFCGVCHWSWGCCFWIKYHSAALESDSAAVPATGLATGTATPEAVETTVLSAATFTTAVEDSLWLALSLRRGHLVLTLEVLHSSMADRGSKFCISTLRSLTANKSFRCSSDKVERMSLFRILSWLNPLSTSALEAGSVSTRVITARIFW